MNLKELNLKYPEAKDSEVFLQGFYLEYIKGRREVVTIPFGGGEWESKDAVTARITHFYTLLEINAAQSIMSCINAKVTHKPIQSKIAYFKYVFSDLKDRETSYLEHFQAVLIDHDLDAKMKEVLLREIKELELQRDTGIVTATKSTQAPSEFYTHKVRWRTTRNDFVAIVDIFFEQLVLDGFIDQKPSDEALSAICLFDLATGDLEMTAKSIGDIRSKQKRPTQYKIGVDLPRFRRQWI